MRSLRSPRRLTTILTAAVALVAAMITVPATSAAAVGPADHVLYWNDVLLRTYRQVGGAPGPLARAGAMMHGAIYDAANSALCAASDAQCLGQAYKIKVAPTAGVVPDVATAIDYAAYDILHSVYPSIDFNADLTTAQSGIPASAARTDGQRMGDASANAMISFRSGDGYPDTSTYPLSTTPGVWRPTGSGAAATPSWGLVRPFVMTSGAQFRPGLPGGYANISDLLASSLYATNVNQVKSLGSSTSTARTATQTQIAWFWANDLDGTYKPPGQLFAHTKIVSQAGKVTQAGNAKLFAMVALAMGDAGIAAWDAKYQTPIDLWRPETAIALADTDNNAATTKDANWRPLSADRNGVNFSPPFPAWISGHATFAAAWAGAMSGFFGSDTFSFTATTEDPHASGVIRAFADFSSAAAENAQSRIYLGVHYQFDADDGRSTGTNVAQYLAANFMRPTASYAFDGYYRSGTYIGDLIDSTAAPASIPLSFRVTSGGATVTDVGAILSYSWNGTLGSSSAPTYNATTGRFDITLNVSKGCAGHIFVFSVLLRDGTRHPINVNCDIV